MTWGSSRDEVRAMGIQWRCVLRLFDGGGKKNGKHISAILASGSTKCLEFSRFSSGWKDLERRFFISCFLRRRTQPWGVYGLRKLVTRRACTHDDLCMRPRSDLYTHTHTHKSYLCHRTASEGKEEVTYTLPVTPSRIFATFNTQTRQSLGSFPENTEITIHLIFRVRAGEAIVN